MLCLSLLCFSGGSLFGQIGGGGGIIHVTGDPDLILATQNVDINEGNICFDRAAQIVYFFDPAGTAGTDQWNGVSVSSLTDTDTRLTNPRVTGGELVFDILDVITNTTSGTVSVDILDIAPVQDVDGAGDITVTDDGNGNYTVSFTEALTSLVRDADTLVYVDEDGATNRITLPTSDGSDTQVTGVDDITVTGTGTVADPYEVSFTEALTILGIDADTLLYTDEDGTVNRITLPTSDGSDTQVTGADDITVTGTGTVADPYIVSFTEALTDLSIDADTLLYTDEDGTVNRITLPTSDGSDTQVTGVDDITVTGTGTVADPYEVSFTEALTILGIDADTLLYTDEDGTVNRITLPTSDGSDTQVTGADDITVTGTGTVADPYIVSFTEALTDLSIDADTLLYTDEDGTVNRITLPTSDGSDTQVTGIDDITVTGTGTVADPYEVSFTEALTILGIDADTLLYTDEDGTVNRITLPTSDGSDTQVTGADDITVTGTGTVADPYVVSFTEALTDLSIDADTLLYTDEDGTVNRITLPTSDGSDTQVTGVDDITVTGTGTVADPYEVSFTEALTILGIDADTLLYTDEDGTVNRITLPTSDGSDTQVQGSNSITVTGDGTAATPYTIQVAGAHTPGNAGGVPVTDGAGNLTWTDVVQSAAILSTGALQLTFTDGSTAIVDLDTAPKVGDMSEVATAVTNLTTAGHPSGIVIAEPGNTFGLPATANVGVIFFIKQ